MPTRIYLPSSGSAAVTPSTWNFANQINPLTFAGVTTKISSAMTSKTEATGTTNPTARAMFRWVIGPLEAQTISGNIKGQMRGSENNAGANATLAVAVKIIQPDGTDRAVLLAQTAADSASSPFELLTTLTNRKFYDAAEATPISLTAQSATKGDYLVIEVGFRSATGTSRNITLSYGDDSGTDLPEDTTTTAANNPWIEFSGDIGFVIVQADSINNWNDNREIEFGYWSGNGDSITFVDNNSLNISYNASFDETLDNWLDSLGSVYGYAWFPEDNLNNWLDDTQFIYGFLLFPEDSIYNLIAAIPRYGIVGQLDGVDTDYTFSYLWVDVNGSIIPSAPLSLNFLNQQLTQVDTNEFQYSFLFDPSDTLILLDDLNPGSSYLLTLDDLMTLLDAIIVIRNDVGGAEPDLVYIGIWLTPRNIGIGI